MHGLQTLQTIQNTWQEHPVILAQQEPAQRCSMDLQCDQPLFVHWIGMGFGVWKFWFRLFCGFIYNCIHCKKHVVPLHWCWTNPMDIQHFKREGPIQGSTIIDVRPGAFRWQNRRPHAGLLHILWAVLFIVVFNMGNSGAGAANLTTWTLQCLSGAAWPFCVWKPSTVITEAYGERELLKRVWGPKFKEASLVQAFVIRCLHDARFRWSHFV